jgi:hypothetical protein
VRVRNEGEFWMSFDDFAKQFSHLDLVHIGKYLCCSSGMIFLDADLTERILPDPALKLD